MRRKLPISLDDREASLTLVEPDGRPVSAVLFWLPAMGTPAKVYLNFAEKLAAKGWAVVLCDYRGHGESGYTASSEENFGFKEILENDLLHYWRQISSIFPSLPIFIGGHSLGGQFASLFAGTIQDQLSGVVLIGSGLPYYKCFSGLRSLWFKWSIKFIRRMALMNGYYPGVKIGFGENEGKNLILDWAECGLHGFYRVNNSLVNWENMIKQQKQPVLAVSFSQDSYAPKSSLNALLKKMPEAKVSQYELGPAMFAQGSADHFHWLKEPNEVVRKLVQWA
ncbi:MAG: alpha/beta hydrolase family protein [bacterium]